MKEGSLEAPMRHPIAWNDESFYDEAALDAELRRVFDICHGCRRCFNLCGSFPKLFDLVDESPNEEVSDLTAADLKAVVDECTLCDMCFMVKCPYVPPHEFAIDFPHLLLRARAAQEKQGVHTFAQKQVRKTDRNGALATSMAWLANWATKTSNGFARGLLATFAGIDPRAWLPKYVRAADTLVRCAPEERFAIAANAPATGKIGRAHV